MKKIISILIIVVVFTSCKGQTSKAIQTIDVKAFSEKLQTTEKPQLLDVRTPEEYNIEHITNATNVNWNGSDFVAKASNYDKTKPIFVYCKVGGRSGQAAEKLAELGFTTIYNLDGGMMKWSATGYSKPSTEKVGMTKAEFEKLIVSDKKVLIDFYAKWCGPCKKMAPYLEKMKVELKDKVIIIKIDADEHKTLCQELKIDALPRLILYEKGKEIWKNTGYISEEDLKKQL
ncbi:thioredoxin domain-containing protein [Flavobacterium sp.]|uniref:thioredoxin domain-containing protein n=1 Tax=Flavobacterium sp. TaxID=239 RepID=UPI0037510699